MKKRIISALSAIFCLFYLSIPAFAGTGNPYQDSHGQGYSEYQVGSHPASGGNSGTNAGGIQSNGGFYNGAGGNNHGGMPGSGTQSGGNSGIPGSGTGYYPGASSWTPGSQIQPLPTSGAGNPHPSGSFPGGTSGGGGSASNHFDASLGSDGSITINLPGAEGVSAGDPSSAISLIFQKYKKIAAVITGICVITAILSLLIQITKLGAAGDNERMRAMALKGIIFSGSALAVFGSLAAVVGIFWNAFI